MEKSKKLVIYAKSYLYEGVSIINLADFLLNAAL